MIRFKRHGPRFEILVSLSLLVAAAVGLVGLVVFKYTQAEMITLTAENGLILVRTLEEKLINNGTGSARDLEMKASIRAMELNGFTSVIILNRAGNILARSKSWNDQLSQNRLKSVMNSNQGFSDISNSGWLLFGTDPNLLLAAPLRDGPRVVGVVGMYSPLSRLKLSWSRTRLIIFGYVILDTLVMVIFGWYLLSRRLAAPLSSLLLKVRALAEDRYSPEPPEAGGTGEIAELEYAFMEMADKLVTQRINLEENIAVLNKTKKSLARSEKMATVGGMAAGLAHELGNPLGSLLGFLHLLSTADLPLEKQQDFLSRMKSELTRMDTIIHSLLSFARPEKVELYPVDINAVVRESLKLAEVQKWFRGIEVELNLDPDLPKANAEENRLTQILLNLLKNAAQAMPKPGRITIHTYAEGNLLIEVVDRGVGISEDDMKRIFDPFFSSKEPGQGTGLGLTLSRSLAESFGGDIEVACEPGQGTVFSVILLKA